MSKRIHLSLAGFLLFVSCSTTNSEENKIPTTRPVENPNPTVPTAKGYEFKAVSEDGCKVSGKQEPFSCLVKRCSDAGGSYNEEDSTCLCPGEKTFISWGKGACVQNAVTNACVNRFEGFSKAAERGEEELRKCWDIGSSGGSWLLLNPAFTQDISQEAEWADQHAVLLKDRVRHLPNLFTQYAEEWVVGPHYISSLSQPKLMELANPIRVPLASLGEIETPGQLFYVAEPDELADALKPVRVSPGLGTPSLSNPLLVRIAEGTTEILSKKFKPEIQEYYTEDGCAGHCEISQEIEIAGGLVSHHIVFAGGRKLQEKVIFWETKNKEVASAMVFLLPSGRVSHIITSEAASNHEPFVREMAIWDRKFNPLLKRPLRMTLLNDWNALTQNLSKSAPWNLQNDKPKAVVCESGFTTDTLEKIGPENITRGPKASLGNFFGWLGEKNETNILTPRNTSGVFPLGTLGFRIPFQSFQEHARRVSELLLGAEKDLSLIPIGIEHCANSLGEWLPLVKESGKAKWVNFSAVMDYTPEACESSAMGKTILANADTLFVVPAGNDSKDYSSTLPNYCPQNLKRAKNLLVVGSQSGNGVANISNRGSALVDLFADGAHLEEGNQSYATSFAAPRVTRVAAWLGKTYPNLTVEQIRSVLLLSVDIPQTYWGNLNPLPAKSGGTLNEERARQMGEFLAREPALQNEALVVKSYCWSGAGCKAASVRNDFFKKNGLMK